MTTTTTFSIDGHTIKEYKGIVRGITFRLPTIRQGYDASESAGGTEVLCYGTAVVLERQA